MIWALVIYTIGVYATWSWRNSDPETLADADDLIVAYGWPVFAVAYIVEGL